MSEGKIFFYPNKTKGKKRPLDLLRKIWLTKRRMDTLTVGLKKFFRFLFWGEKFRKCWLVHKCNSQISLQISHVFITLSKLLCSYKTIKNIFITFVFYKKVALQQWRNKYFIARIYIGIYKYLLTSLGNFAD